MDFADNILNNLFDNVRNPENAVGVDELLDRYKLNWKVDIQPLSLPDNLATDFKGVVRVDNGNCFATCKDSFVPYQNSELAELLIRLSDKTGYNIYNGGMFNGGAKVYLQLESPNKIKGIGENNDTVNGYLTGINGHDGTTALRWGETNITVSCTNTFAAASKKLKHSIRHTRSIHKQVEEEIHKLNKVLLQEKTLFDTFINLSEIPVKKQAITEIVKEITTVDINKTRAELKQELSSYSLNRSDELLQSIANEMAQKGQTMWGLLSGVTRYTSHVMPVPKRENGRLESLYIGSGYEVNNKALDKILEFA